MDASITLWPSRSRGSKKLVEACLFRDGTKRLRKWLGARERKGTSPTSPQQRPSRSDLLPLSMIVIEFASQVQLGSVPFYSVGPEISLENLEYGPFFSSFSP